MPALYPHEESGERLNWENYDHRRSLVRALKFAVKFGLLNLIEGDSERFALRADGEALYEVTVLARYYLRSYPKNLQQYQSIYDLQAAELFDDDASAGIGRRARVYRNLLLTPAYNVASARQEDFLYLRNMHRRLGDEFGKYTVFDFELYKDCAMLISPERVGTAKQVFLREIVRTTVITPLVGQNDSSVFIVENAGVFSAVLDRSLSRPLVSLNGQFKLASWALLDRLSQSGACLYYSGDFDPEGLQMAQKLLFRYPNNIKLWHMDCTDYFSANPQLQLEEHRLTKLDSITHPDLKPLALLIKAEKRVAYQEGILELLISDCK